MSVRPPRRWRQSVPTGHTTMSIDEVVVLARAVLDFAPAPLPKEVRRMLSDVVYRCAVVPEAYENPDWLALREQVFAPGVDPLLDMLGHVIPLVATLAEEAPSPVLDQALTELSELPEKIVVLGRNGSVPPMMQRELIMGIKRILERVKDSHRPG